MRYLMLPEDMGQYEDGFWATVDYSAPTGTTVDSTPLKRAVGTAWAERTPTMNGPVGWRQESGLPPPHKSPLRTPP